MKDMLEEKMGEGKDTCFMLRGGGGRGNLRIEGGENLRGGCHHGGHHVECLENCFRCK